MVILPSYYAASLTADQEQVIQYYVDICESSPVSTSWSVSGVLKLTIQTMEDPHSALQFPGQFCRPRHVFGRDRSYNAAHNESLRRKTDVGHNRIERGGCR
jgi:hypothetical protein